MTVEWRETEHVENVRRWCAMNHRCMYCNERMIKDEKGKDVARYTCPCCYSSCQWDRATKGYTWTTSLLTRERKDIDRLT